MTRRFTKEQMITFAQYVLQHPVECFNLGMVEYAEVCSMLKVAPHAVKKSKFVNLINMNRLLGEFNANKEKWISILNGSKNDEVTQDLELNVFEQRNENCQCEDCARRSSWSGIRRYKFSQYKFKETSLYVDMEHNEWKQYSTIDSRGNYKLKPGKI